MGDWVVLKGVGEVLRSRWAALKLPLYKKQLEMRKGFKQGEVPVAGADLRDRGRRNRPSVSSLQSLLPPTAPLVAGLASSKADPPFPNGQGPKWREAGCPLGEQRFPAGRQRCAGGGGPFPRKGLTPPLLCTYFWSLSSGAFSLGLVWSPGSKSLEAVFTACLGAAKKGEQGHLSPALLLLPPHAWCPGCPLMSRDAHLWPGVPLCPGMKTPSYCCHLCSVNSGCL